MSKKDKYSEQKLEQIRLAKQKKNARGKARKARNAVLRELGEKFSKKEACYKPKNDYEII